MAIQLSPRVLPSLVQGFKKKKKKLPVYRAELKPRKRPGTPESIPCLWETGVEVVLPRVLNTFKFKEASTDAEFARAG